MATSLTQDAVHAVYDTINPTKSLQENAKGKVVLITGAGRGKYLQALSGILASTERIDLVGIGQAIAKAFAQASAKSLILAALEESELEETEAIVKSLSPSIQVFYRALDVRDAGAVEKFIGDSSRWSSGVIDVLCCNAGISPPLKPIVESDPDQWWMGLEVNLKGPYLFTRYVLPIMQKQKHGCIILTASRAAVTVTEKASSYQISKLAVARLADSIHAENFSRGIKVFAIHPGGIVTRMITDMNTNVTEPWGKEAYDTIRPMLQDDISLPGNACVYLASGKVDFLSGRYVDTTISFDDILKNKEKIIEHNLFKIGISGNWNSSGGIVHMLP